MATTIDRYKLIIDTQGSAGGIGQLTGMLRGMGPLVVAAFAVTAVVKFGQQVIEVGKRFENMRNQLRLVTNSAAELESVFSALQQVSNRTGAELDATVELYQKLDLATGALGKSTDDILKITENFQKALALSGADANTASAAIRQFGQAMASGTVRGDEFVSIVEALGPALAIISRESGYTIGDLRRLSQAGELTAEVFGNMIQETNALNTAFASLSLTTDQVEGKLGKTFDEVLNKVDETVGITKIYREVLAQLNRDLADLFNTSQSLENLSLKDLADSVENNALRIDEALVELRGRYADLNIFQVFGEQGTAIRELVKQLEALKIARQEEAAATEAEQSRITALTEPYTRLEAQLDQVSEAYNRNRPQVEKLREEYERTQTLLQELEALRGTEIEQHVQLAGSIETTRGRLSQLEEAMQRLQAPTDASSAAIQRFYDSTIRNAQESVTQIALVQGALDMLNSSGLQTTAPDLYSEALRNLQNQLGETASATTRLNSEVEDFFSSAEQRLQRQRDQLELSGLFGVEQDVTRIRQEEERALDAAIARIRASGATTDEIESQIAALRERTALTIRDRQELERLTQTTARETATRQEAAEEAAKRAQRTFANGWKSAYETYANSARDAFSQAETLFQKTTKGMEDALVGFARTGKFEWKSFVQDITETLLRSQIRGLIADIFGGGGGTGATGGSSGNMITDLLGKVFGADSQVSNTPNNPLGDLLGGGSTSGFADGSANNPFYVVPVGGSLGSGGGTGFQNIGGNVATDMGFRAPQLDYLASQLTGGITSAFTPFESLVKRSRFAGGFANGGFIPAGSYGMVGEGGPEMVNGPASVTPMGNQTVNYNINAVDAKSFKQLVAEDPGFIHAVASMGGQQVPRRRR